jgi:penicillin amidase
LRWDFVLSQDSIPAAIYVAWEHAVRKAVWGRFVPAKAANVFNERALSMAKMIEWLTKPDGHFGADPVAARDRLLVESLDQAASELERRLGPDMTRWRYGQDAFKHVQLKHPLSDAVTTETRRRLDSTRLPRGGSSQTVNNTSDDDNQSAGASFRIIADTGDWDRSVGTNTPGQSGDPESPHYDDLYKPWVDGQYFPVSFSQRQVDTVAEAKTLLVP